MDKRNWKIYWEWIEGKEYAELAQEFNLSHDTIKKICLGLVPLNVRNTWWQRANAYRKFREWKRNAPKISSSSKPLETASGISSS